MNGITGPRDNSLFGNPPARIPKGTKFAPGPDKRPSGSVELPIRRKVYIRIPNRKGTLDTKTALSYLLWVYRTGRKGSIVSHGITTYVRRNGRLLIRLEPRRGRPIFIRVLRKLPLRRWSYIAVSYELRGAVGVFELYLNSRRVLRRVFKGMSRFILNTRGSPLVGGFSGRVACLRFYRAALTGRQLARRKKKCFRKCS